MKAKADIKIVGKDKPKINIVVIGHVDSGKSTTSGHLIYKCGGVDEREIQRLENEAKLIGKESFKYAWILSKLKAEREKGITITTSQYQFETKKNIVTIIDAPGHRDFIKNMITGASQADAALIIINADIGGFETGFSENGQTKEHALLAYTMGIKQLVVGVNKMDAVLYSQERFEDIKREVLEYLTKTGFKESAVTFVPYSGFNGENLVEKSDKLAWFKGGSLLDAIDKFVPPAKPVDKPLRIPIQDVYKITNVGVVPVGRIETGILRKGAAITIAPGNHNGVCKSVESEHINYDEAEAGMNVGFNVKGIEMKNIKRGSVCGEAKNDAPRTAKSFTAQVVLIGVRNAIVKGYTPLIDCHTSHTACKFEELISKIDRRTGRETEKDPSELKNGDSAIVKLTPVKDMVVESYSEYPQLGRFAIRDSSRTIGVGLVKSVEKEDIAIKKK
jgi:elongation factor 1-alpha